MLPPLVSLMVMLLVLLVAPAPLSGVVRLRVKVVKPAAPVASVPMTLMFR